MSLRPSKSKPLVPGASTQRQPPDVRSTPAEESIPAPLPPAPPTGAAQRRLGFAAFVRAAATLLLAFVLAMLNLGLIALSLLAVTLLYDAHRTLMLRKHSRRVRLMRQMLTMVDFEALVADYPAWVKFTEQEQAITINAIVRQLWPVMKVAIEQVGGSSTDLESCMETALYVITSAAPCNRPFRHISLFTDCHEQP